MAPEPTFHVVLIDLTGRVRPPEMAILRAAAMEVHLVTSLAAPGAPRAVDVVVADLRSTDTRPGAVLRLAFDYQRPVVVITTAVQVDSRLAALRYGAVDHVVAPTEARELVERVRHAARIVRAERAVPGLDLEIEIDHGARTLRRSGRAAALTPVELAVLDVLVEREGQVVTKAEIGEALANHPRPNTVEVHVSTLRRKLESVGAPPIKTVHGRGYLFRLATDGLPRSGGPTTRVADLVAQRQRLIGERDEFVRRRDEILRNAEVRRTVGPRGDGRGDARTPRPPDGPGRP